MKRIDDIKLKKKADEDAKRMAEVQESMLRNFAKKPTMGGNTGPNSEGGEVINDSGFNLKRNSKSSNQ